MAKKTNADYLRMQLEELDADTEYLDGLIEDHEAEIEELKDEVSDLKDENTTLEERVTELENDATDDPDFETLETPLGTFEYIMPDNLRMQGFVQDFLERLKNI